MKKGQIQKVKDFLQPEIDKRIVCNNLVFVESQKFNNKDKALYLVFAAYNNELNEYQKVIYQPKTGLFQISIQHAFIFPEN